jgi:zinc/manganese transport system permease protein
MLEFLWPPLLACLVLTGIHVYLGLHVLARGVIFVDLALAQIAALGITVAFLAGHPIESSAAYWYALVFTVGGAALFAVSRIRQAPIPHEAVIGIVYAVSAAVAVLVVDRAPLGGEHIKQLLVGNILTVTPSEVARLAVLYLAIGVFHAAIRRPLLEISFRPETAIEKGRRIRWWDFCFYVTFGVVVTSSVRIAGVLLVFSYLVVPAAVGALLSASVTRRLVIGWALGFLVSILGLSASFAWDLPTGAAVVTTFGVLMAAVALGLGVRSFAGRVRRAGARALAPVGALVSAVVAAAGLFLALFPQMDHHWLDWIERAAPGVELAFLMPGERQTYEYTRADVERQTAQLERLRRMQQEADFGLREMSPEIAERLRQFLASAGEITAGDRMVLATLRSHARERQRLWLGLPLFALGITAAFVLARAGRPRRQEN